MYVAHERRAYLLRLLQQQGSLHSATVARELGVTDETIRTDLVALQQQGLLKRVHGGALYILPRQGSEDGTRLDCQLAAQAAAVMEAGMTLYLENSPFAVALAAQLVQEEKPCTLITNSPRLLTRLSAAALPHQLLCPGGLLDKESGLLDSQSARMALHQLAPNFAVLCPPAAEAGAAMYRHALQAEWAQLAADAAERSIIIAPAAAFSRSAPHRAELAPFLLVTEDNLPPELADAPLATVPAITAEDVMQDSGFDY